MIGRKNMLSSYNKHIKLIFIILILSYVINITLRTMECQPIIHQIDTPLIRVEIIKRPSASIKSPYVADILLPDGTQTLGHTPALGCCGLVEPSKFVYAIETPGNKCSHRILRTVKKGLLI